MKQVITATLESQKKGGCIALKFEAAYLRTLQFEKAGMPAAAKIYSQYASGAVPPHTEYKLLQDFLFHYIAKEAGRLGLAIHIHSFPGAGDYFVAAGSDPILLETMFNDPELSQTKFVLIHGGGPFVAHTSAMLWKPNVYIDISLLTQLWTPNQLANVLREYLSQFPEKVLFGSDAVSFGPGMGWELSAWIATTSGRQALGIALSAMIRSNEISRGRAEEIATMVMRSNADSLYHLGLH
jgi:predicted TIM-barrel fold metal-dependent hydrolase